MSYTEQFETFWQLYPGRTNKLGRIRKQDKLGAFVEWHKLTAKEQQLAMSGHPEQDGFTPDARKWLKWNRWEDEDVTEKKRQAQIELNRRLRANTIRASWSSWIKEQTNITLKELIRDKPHLTWLVRELRPEIFNV